MFEIEKKKTSIWWKNKIRTMCGEIRNKVVIKCTCNCGEEEYRHKGDF